VRRHGIEQGNGHYSYQIYDNGVPSYIYDDSEFKNDDRKSNKEANILLYKRVVNVSGGNDSRIEHYTHKQNTTKHSSGFTNTMSNAIAGTVAGSGLILGGYIGYNNILWSLIVVFSLILLYIICYMGQSKYPYQYTYQYPYRYTYPYQSNKQLYPYNFIYTL